MVKFLLKCHDVIGQAMAGPAIRYWEFAKALSKKHPVTLLVPNSSPLHSNQFEVLSSKEPIDYKNYEVLISQLIDPKTALLAKKAGVRLIYDAYDPEPLEHLEIFKSSSLNTRIFLNQKIINTVNFSLEMADGILCANPKQKDLWTGFLLSLKKIDPKLYDKDSSLKKLITIVPFGISSKEPEQTKPGFRKQFDLKSSDKLLVWGGGIWNWFDPLTLITAIKLLSKKRDDIKLVFMGIIHPNASAIPAMSMALEAKNLAQSFNLINKSVYFNETWIPYEERQNYLLEADLGISIHAEHLETRYSFRTRLLDYMWANLPIIATQGDSFEDLIKKERLGLTVPPYNAHSLAQTIEQLLDDAHAMAEIKANINRFKTQFFWETIINPIEDMADFLKDEGPASLTLRDLTKITTCAWRKVGPYAMWQKTKIYLKTAISNGA